MQTLSSTFIFSYWHNRKKEDCFSQSLLLLHVPEKADELQQLHHLCMLCTTFGSLHTFHYWQHFRILAWCVAICGVRTWAVFILKHKVGHPHKVWHDAFATTHGVRCTMLPHYVSWVRLVNSYCFGPSRSRSWKYKWNNLQVKHHSRWDNTTKGWL